MGDFTATTPESANYIHSPHDQRFQPISGGFELLRDMWELKQGEQKSTKRVVGYLARGVAVAPVTANITADHTSKHPLTTLKH